MERVGPMAYQLAFLPNLKIHNSFHISILKKYVHHATHVIYWNVIMVEPEGDFLAKPDYKKVILATSGEGWVEQSPLGVCPLLHIM